MREHLQLVALAHGAADETLERGSIRCCAVLALADKADARPGQLSRGMRQKAQLACALIRPSRLLVLDEPVVGLDPASQRTLRELLLEAKRADRAVLLTTHQLEFARGIADRAVLLADGEVVAAGPYDEIVDGPLVRRLRAAVSGIRASVAPPRRGRSLAAHRRRARPSPYSLYMVVLVCAMLGALGHGLVTTLLAGGISATTTYSCSARRRCCWSRWRRPGSAPGRARCRSRPPTSRCC